MNVKDAARRLEVSPSLVYSLIAAGKLRHYRIGNGRGAIRLSDEHVAEFLNGAEPKPPAPTPDAPSRIERPKFKHLHLP